MLAHVGAGGHRVPGQPAHPARRNERPVRRMEDRAEVEAVERRRELVDPLDREAVLAQRVVLAAKRGALRLVGGEPEAPDAPERVARKRLDAVERANGQLHQEPGAFRPEVAPGEVVRHRGASEREAAVAAARPTRDFARLVEPDAHASLGQRERAGAAGDPSADHGDLGAPCEATWRELRGRFVEPV